MSTNIISKTVTIVIFALIMITISSVKPVSAFDGEGSLSENNIVRLDKDDFDTVEDYMKYLEEHPEAIGPSVAEIEANALNNINVTVTLQYKLQNGTNCELLSTAFQKTYIDGDNIYVLQRKLDTDNNPSHDMQLTRCLISGNVATAQDMMTLTDFGHSQTLDLIDHTLSGQPRFIIACNYNTSVGDSYWSLNIGRLTYVAGSTANYTDIPSLTSINYANKNHTSYGTVKRVDAALSSDKTKLIIWMKTANTNNIQYSIYNMTGSTGINAIFNNLEQESTKILSCNSNAVKNNFLGGLQQLSQDAFLPNNSFQGLELNDNLTMFINGGKNNEVPKVAYVTGSINSTYDYNCTWVYNASLFGYINNVNVLAANSNAEIESPQLINNTLYISVYRVQKSQANGKYSIFSTPVSAFSSN